VNESEEKTVFHMVSFSGGKDSTAMLLRMIEEGMPIDAVVFCDTGLEFPAMYDHIDKVEKNTGITITRLKSQKPFEYLMFEQPVHHKESNIHYEKVGAVTNGYGWAGSKMRWCTRDLKDTPRKRYERNLRKQYEIKHYVGIAADEQYRLARKNNQNPNHVHPLVDWNMTEADCLKYCYERGYDWGGLYEHFHRVSCWCCPLQSLNELRQLWKHYPALWEKMKEWDQRNWRQFKASYSVEELEKRFLFEEECISAGKPIKGKKFFTELRERLDMTA